MIPRCGEVYEVVQKGQLMGQTNWTSLGLPGGQPDDTFFPPQVVQNADGRLEVFLANLSDGTLWHIWQLTPNGTWSSWAWLGHPSNTSSNPPFAARNADGRLEIFMIGSDQNLWHIWQTAPGGSWSSWNSLGTPASGTLSLEPPTVGRNPDGRLEAFHTSYGAALWHIWQTAPGGSWSSWNSLDQPPSVSIDNACVVQNKDGHLEVLVSGLDAINQGTLWHIWQQTPGGMWGGWASLGHPPNTSSNPPFAARNADGRLEVFMIGSDGNLWHTWQLTPGGEWGS
jgi:hypothetical protein